MLRALTGTATYAVEPGYATASFPSYSAPAPPSTCVLPTPSYSAGDGQQQGGSAAPHTPSANGFGDVDARDDLAEPASAAATQAPYTASGQAADSASVPTPAEQTSGSMPYDPAYDADMRAALAGHGLDQSLAYESNQGAGSVTASTPDQEAPAAVSGQSRRETMIEDGYEEDVGSRSLATQDAVDAPALAAGAPLLIEYEHDSGATGDAGASLVRRTAGEGAEQGLVGVKQPTPQLSCRGLQQRQQRAMATMQACCQTTRRRSTRMRQGTKHYARRQSMQMAQCKTRNPCKTACSVTATAYPQSQWATPNQERLGIHRATVRVFLISSHQGTALAVYRARHMAVKNQTLPTTSQQLQNPLVTV